MDYAQNLLLTSDVHFTIMPWMLWSGFALFILMYLCLSAVLYYHWIVYGMRAHGILIAEIIFPFGSALFVYIACIGLGIF